MIAIINFESDTACGFTAKLRQYFFPLLRKRVAEQNILTESMIVYDVPLPILFDRGVKKTLGRVYKELMRDGIDKVIMPKGTYSKSLSEKGVNILTNKETMADRLCEIIDYIVEKSQIDKMKVKFAVFDKNGTSLGKNAINNLIKVYDNMTVITENEDFYSEVTEEILTDCGAGIIITDKLSDIGKNHIIISVSDTVDIYKQAKVGKKSILFSLDEEFSPKAYLPSDPINTFCYKIPYELQKYCPFGMSYCEFAGILWDCGVSEKTETKEIALYSFGKKISFKRLANELKRSVS